MDTRKKLEYNRSCHRYKTVIADVAEFRHYTNNMTSPKRDKMRRSKRSL